MKRYKLFSQLLSKLTNGLTITFNRHNVAFGDDFLIFGPARPEQKITFRRHGDLWYIFFEDDEPMLLEDAPDSFFESILKNIDNAA